MASEIFVIVCVLCIKTGKSTNEHNKKRIKTPKISLSDQKHENELKRKNIATAGEAEKNAESNRLSSGGTHGEICLRYKV